MKYFLLVVATLSFNLMAAKPVPGSKCGLVDQWGDFDDSSTTYDLSRSLRQLKTLNKAVKSQLVASANLVAEFQMDKEKFKVADLKAATEYIKDASEGGDLYVEKAELNGKKYSVISYFGGGNHEGYIFPWGKTKPVASIGDDDISCIQ